MAPKIFLTGATGYIGGDALYALHDQHPDWEYTTLVRTQDKADAVQKAFPTVRIVIGGLDDVEVLEEEAKKCDVVVHTADASDHAPAAHAIAKGLAAGHTPSKPGSWLHTGGTGILCWEDMRPGARLGTWSDKEYNDWSGVDALTSLPDDAFHRDVDKIVLEAGGVGGGKTGVSDRVKTAVLCPPTIYGRGRGPLNTRSRQAYELAKFILTKHYIPVIGDGLARWNNVHVHDLSALFVLLAEAAVLDNSNKRDDPQLWGAKGYFLVENAEHKWSDLARLMGDRALALGMMDKTQAKGAVKLDEKKLAQEEAIEVAGFQAVSWGLNSRGKAERAGKTVGWRAEVGKGGIEKFVEEILRDEVERLG